MTHRSIRLMPRSLQDTLRGYIFSDTQHARAWLTQEWVRPDDYRLKEVEVGELCRCTRCDGSGYTQTVKTLGELTVAEFLAQEK